MDDLTDLHILQQLRRKWIFAGIAADIISAAAIAFLSVALFHKFWNGAYWWFAVLFPAAFIVLYFVHRSWKLKESGLVQWLDQSYPALEESTGLLLRPPGSLNSLETLQSKKVRENLIAIPAPLQTSKKFLSALAMLALAMLTGIFIQFIPVSQNKNLLAAKPGATGTKPPGKLLPALAGMEVTIHPPAYTGKVARRQQAFNIVAEEGAMVNWTLQTNLAASRVAFIFNDTLRLVLQRANETATSWQFRTEGG